MAKKSKAGKKKKTARAKSKGKAAPKRSASRKTVRKPKAGKPAKRPARSGAGPRHSWLDENTHTPIIERYARQLTSFIDAMADGVIEESELKAQENRIVQLMKEIEPQLDERIHEKITHLLCELTAYDIMQMLHAMQSQRPQTVFQG